MKLPKFSSQSRCLVCKNQQNETGWASLILLRSEDIVRLREKAVWIKKAPVAGYVGLRSYTVQTELNTIYMRNRRYLLGTHQTFSSWGEDIISAQLLLSVQDQLQPDASPEVSAAPGTRTYRPAKLTILWRNMSPTTVNFSFCLFTCNLFPLLSCVDQCGVFVIPRFRFFVICVPSQRVDNESALSGHTRCTRAQGGR